MKCDSSLLGTAIISGKMILYGMYFFMINPEDNEFAEKAYFVRHYCPSLTAFYS